MSALKMPWKAKVLIVLCYLLPLVIDTDGTRELIWMLLLIPAIFLAYFQGLKGGLSAASIGAALELGREAFEYFVEPVDFSSDNLVVFVVVFLTTLLSTIGIGILCDKLRKAIDEAEYLAFHDDLSGLPNRRLFADRLALALSHARRNKQMVAVMFLDLDRFKNVNDTMGHSSGDLLIKGVANRWKACLREEDTLSRLGGDEFTILLDNVSDADGIVTVAKRIMASLEQPFKLRNKEINISASAGIAVYPRDGQTAESLMQHADAAMYQAKESGVNTYLFFSQDMNATVSRKVLVEENMRKAFELEEFRLNYQAQVNLKTHEIKGMEALIRWHSPNIGIVSPTEFIKLAEENGLIVRIGEWVLKTACNQAKKWQDKGYPALRLSVNISSIQLIHDGFIDSVKRVLSETDFEPRCLELEITESISVNGFRDVVDKLQALRKLGIHISVDDFGTGYSSLSYLRYLPIDTLKIDRSFVKDIELNDKNKAVVSAIMAIATTMNCRTIAEGVEKFEELACLKELGCKEIQGYIYSKPLSAEQFEVLLEEFNAEASERRYAIKTPSLA